MNVGPSDKFIVLVERVHGNPNLAAEAWGISSRLIYRFLSGEGGLSLDTAGQICSKSGLTFNDLFVIRTQPRKRKLLQPV